MKIEILGKRIFFLEKNLSSYKFSLMVEDNGRGMSVSDIRQIEAFMQFDRNIFEQQGSGLGLIIVKRIVEMYDGEMKIENKPGAGILIAIKFDGRETR